MENAVEKTTNDEQVGSSGITSVVGTDGISGKSQNNNWSFNPNSHKYRRLNERYTLRNDKYYVVDHLGKRTITNKLKKRTRNENYNFKEWFNRIKRSSKVGRNIHRINEEEAYNFNIRQIEEQQSKYLTLLKEVYGEELSQSKYNSYLKNFEERINRKNNKDTV